VRSVSVEQRHRPCGDGSTAFAILHRNMQMIGQQALSVPLATGFSRWFASK
jgi:hypothetical protein